MLDYHVYTWANKTSTGYVPRLWKGQKEIVWQFSKTMKTNTSFLKSGNKDHLLYVITMTFLL